MMDVTQDWWACRALGLSGPGRGPGRMSDRRRLLLSAHSAAKRTDRALVISSCTAPEQPTVSCANGLCSRAFTHSRCREQDRPRRSTNSVHNAAAAGQEAEGAWVGAPRCLWWHGHVSDFRSCLLATDHGVPSPIPRTAAGAACPTHQWYGLPAEVQDGANVRRRCAYRRT